MTGEVEKKQWRRSLIHGEDHTTHLGLALHTHSCLLSRTGSVELQKLSHVRMSQPHRPT